MIMTITNCHTHILFEHIE